jgi:C-terminal processing protease CtpA/Prc
MKIYKLLFIAILSVSFFASCKKDNVPPTPAVTLTPAMARDSLYDIMNSWYYWNDVMPTVNKDSYADPYLLMDAMLYKPLDRYSFVADFDEFMAEMQGSFVGHGFRIGLDDANNARIAQIYSESPLYSYGVRRGWIVKKINDTDIAPILIANDATAYTNLIGPSEAGVTNKFLFQTPEGKDSVIMSTKASFTLNSVLLADTLHLATGITGHIVFDAFITPSDVELDNAFSTLAANGIQDLILDLRYNGGGYLYIAQFLASYITGTSNHGSDFIKLTYNSLHQDQNSSFALLLPPYPLTLSKIVVITSRGTASASESVMNGLKPYINVISIGDTTYGKPVGMGMPRNDIGKKYFIAPITFKYVNKNGQGDFFEGIAPDALVSDDITHDFNDREELCLKASINYLETGSLATGKSYSPFQRKSQFSEKPAWMKNVFVLDK